MDTLRRHFDLFFAYLTQYAKVRLSYRADFFIGLATSITATIFAFGFLLVLFSKIPRLADWSFEQALFLYGFSLIPYGLFNVISLNLYDFGNSYVIEGKFDRVLLRPVSSLFQVIFEAFRIESLHEVVIGLVAIASQRMALDWGVLDVLLLIFFGICGAIIYLAVFLMLVSVAFWMEDRIGIAPPVWNMIAFGRYPLSIYSPYVQFFLSWIIPFGFANVLSHRAPPRPQRIPHLRLARARSRRRLRRPRPPGMARGYSPIRINRVIIPAVYNLLDRYSDWEYKFTS